MTAWVPQPSPYWANIRRRQSQGLILPTTFPSRPSKFLSLTRVASSNADDNDNGGDDVIDIESLSSSQLVELIDLSFLQACLAMAKTGDMGPLKLFIVSVKAAKEKDHQQDISDLIKAVDNSPAEQIGRPLDPSEKEIRAIWIQAIYLMLWRVECEEDDDENKIPSSSAASALGIEKKVTNLYFPVLDDIIAIYKSGLGLNVDRFVASRKEILMPSSNDSQRNPLLIDNDDGGGDDGGPVQLAIVTQTIKVLYNTVEVLDELQAGEIDTPLEKDDTKKKTKKKKSTKKKPSGGMGFG